MNSPSFEVSPGIGGFFAFFFLAIALWLLMRNMFARLRRMNLAQREAQERAEEAAARRGRDGAGAEGEQPDGSGSDEPDGESGGGGRGDRPEER